VFFYSDIHHVGMYMGNGTILHAANPDDGVLYDNIDIMPFAGAVRVS
jgi:cell wall-associated NlpC family hydrolase